MIDPDAQNVGEPLLILEKERIVWLYILYMAGSIVGLITIGLVTYDLYSHGNYYAILTGSLMIMYVYVFGTLILNGIKEYYTPSRTIKLYPDKVVMEFKRRPPKSFGLDDSIEVDIRYEVDEQGFSPDRLGCYIFLKDKERVLVINWEWGWKKEDLVRMWNPFLEVIERNDLRLGLELSILKEKGGLRARGES